MPYYHLALLTGLVLWASLGMQQQASGQVVLPNFKIFGQHVSTPQVILAVDDNKSDPIYPMESILVFDQGTIIGVVCVYPTEVTFETLIAAIDKRHPESRYGNSDGSFGMVLWRDEVERFGLAAYPYNIFWSEFEGVTLYAMWIDRPLIANEADADTNAEPTP